MSGVPGTALRACDHPGCIAAYDATKRVPQGWRQHPRTSTHRCPEHSPGWQGDPDRERPTRLQLVGRMCDALEEVVALRRGAWALIDELKAVPTISSRKATRTLRALLGDERAGDRDPAVTA